MRSARFEQGVADGKAEFLFFVELAEFAGDGLGDFVGDHFESGGEGVSGADGAGEGVDGFGKFLLKFLEALFAHVRGVGVGEKKPRTTPAQPKMMLPPAMKATTARRSAEAAQSMRKFPARMSTLPWASIFCRAETRSERRRKVSKAGMRLRTSSRSRATFEGRLRRSAA